SQETASEAFFDELWLGTTSIAATVAVASGPHGVDLTLWRGFLPAGPFRQFADDWGWTWDGTDPARDYGCAWTVVAGGGVIAAARVPNDLDSGEVEKPACLGRPTAIHVFGRAAAWHRPFF